MGSRLDKKNRRHDRFFKQAREESYAARSVFKLEEIDKRFKLFARGRRVLDLGCRPGSWMQYALRKVGPKGVVVGIDRQPLDIALPHNGHALIGDILEINAETFSEHCEQFDVVLSDMAPDTSGITFADQARSLELFMRALDIARQLGAPKGHFVGKLFMGEGFEEAQRAAKALYSRTKTVRPEATRKESKELFLVGLERR